MKILLLCDIVGTIDLTKTSNDYKNFKDQLELLKSSYNCSQLTFSLVSTLDYKSVLEYYMLLSSMKNQIDFGVQYFNEGFFEKRNDKILFANKKYISKIYMYKDAIIEQGKNVDEIIIIDDSMTIPYMKIIKKQVPFDLNLSILKPGTDELGNEQYFTTERESLEGTMYLLKQKIRTKNR